MESRGFEPLTFALPVPQSNLQYSREVLVAGRILARKIVDDLNNKKAPISEARAFAELERHGPQKEHALEILAGGPHLWAHAIELCKLVLAQQGVDDAASTWHEG